MFAKFLPREISFFDIFEKHAATIVQAAKEFHRLASTSSLIDFSEKQKFKHWEHEADKLVHHCAEELHRTFITPIAREDILHLISEMDNIIDCIDATFDCLLIYKIDTTTNELRDMSRVLFQATEKVASIVRGLRNMKNAADIKDSCHCIRRLEHEADDILRNAIGQLFENEQNTRMVIKLKEIYENLEKAIDSCHKVANIIEGIVLECV